MTSSPGPTSSVEGEESEATPWWRTTGATTRRGALAALGAGAVGVGLSQLLGGHRRSGNSLGEPNPIELVPESDVTHRAVRSGAWDDTDVWAEGDLPDEGARVLVEPNVEVTLAHQEPAVLEWVRVDGVLAFAPSADTHLRVGTVVTDVGSRLTVGTEADPVRPDATARITFADLGPIDEDADPARQGRGLLARGDVEVHGATTTSWTHLVTHPEAGDEWLELPEAPTNWTSGDAVVLPGLSPEENQDEERTIEAVDGERVRLDSPLAHDHVPPADDLDSYVLHLSRNVVFASETTDVPRRGHVMVMSTGTAFRYLEARELGRTDKSRPFTNPPGGRGRPEPAEPPNPRARYALHFHRTGPTGDQHAVEGCVVRGSPGWGVVNHESSVSVTDSVTYRVFGTGFVAEKGNEVGRFANNFSLRSEGSGELVDARELLVHNRTGHVHDPPNNVDDFGHGGHGFWLQSPAVEVVGNVAAGHRHHGFVYWLRSLVEDPEPDAEETLQSRRDQVPDFPVDLLTDEEARAARIDEERGLAFSSDLPIRLFRSNTCFASGGGIDVSRQQFRSSHFRYPEWGAIEDFTVYGIGPFVDADGERIGRTGGARSGGNLAVDARLCSNLAVRNCRFLGTGDGTAVWRSFPYTDSVLLEGCEISGWAVGFVPPQFNGNNLETIVRECTFDNDVDVEVGGRFAGDLAVRDCSFGDGGDAGIRLNEIDPANASPGRVAIVDTGIELDGRTVYYDVSDPDAVFVPDEEFADRLKSPDRWAEDRFLGEGVSALVGMTTREIYETYGITIRGAVTPPEAEEHPLVAGGVVGQPSAELTQPADEIWIDCTDHDGGTAAHFETVEDDLATAGRALRVTEPDRSRDEPPDTTEAMATYRFSVDSGGRYHAAARLGATEHEGPWRDSLWIRIDGGDWHAWENLFGRYLWHSYRRSGNGSGTQQPGEDLWLDPGEHRIDVGGRGVEVLLDSVLLRHATNGATPIASRRTATE